MNRGFAFYFKNAIKSSATTIWKNRSILPVLMYFLAELVAKLTIFGVVFSLADIRQAKIVDENKRFNIPETLKVSTKLKPVWTLILSIVAEAFIFLGGVLVIAVVTGVLALIGYAVWWLVEGPSYIIALFCLPGAVVLLVYALLMCLIFSPTPYIIETNPDLGVYETVRICFDTMKSKGKLTVFLNFFVPTLIELIIVGICVAGGWLIPSYIDSEYLPVIMAAWYVFSLAFVLLLVPMFDLTRKVAQKSLFDDIVLDPVGAKQRTNGINIRMCKGVKFKPSAIQRNLVALFDETKPDSIPEPDSPARKKIKEKVEKEEKNKKEQQIEKPAEPKPAEPVKEQTVEKPAEPQPAEPVKEQPVEEPAEPEPAESVEEQTVEKPAEPQPAEPVEEKPAEPQEANSEEQKSAEEKPKRKTTTQTKPKQPAKTASTKTAEAKPKSSSTSQTKPRQSTKTASTKTAEAKPKSSSTSQTKPKQPTKTASAEKTAAEAKPKSKSTVRTKTGD